MSRSMSAVALVLYVAVATSIGHVDYHIRAHPERGFAEYSPGVRAGTEPAPGKYRVLAPYVYDALTRATGVNARDSWIVFRWLALLASLLAAHWYFSTWFDSSASVTGSLLVAGLLPLTFTNSWAHPDHLVELCLFTLGCACVARGRAWWLAVIVGVAALNRETSAFLLPLFLFAAPVDRRRIAHATIVALVWLGVTIGLRLWLGFETYDPWQLGRNLEFMRLLPPAWDLYYRAFGWFVVVLALPLVWATVSSWPSLPRYVRVATTLVAPAFVVTGVLFSSVIETRIFTPLLPLLAPAALFALFPGHRLSSSAA